MKRITSFILVAVLLATILSGCGSQSPSVSTTESINVSVMEPSVIEAPEPTSEAEAYPDSKTDVSAIEKESASATDEKLSSIIQYDEDGYQYIDFSSAPDNSKIYPLKDADGITLTYWGGGPNLQAPIAAWDENLVYSEIMKATGVTIEFVSVAGPTLSDNMNLLIASGDYPDIFGEGLGAYSAGYSALVDDEIVIDLAPYLEEYSPNYNWLRENLTDFKILGTTDDGYVVGYLPLILNYSGNSGGLCIRKDWLEAMNMDLPTTYAELETALLGMKEAG